MSILAKKTPMPKNDRSMSVAGKDSVHRGGRGRGGGGERDATFVRMSRAEVIRKGPCQSLTERRLPWSRIRHGIKKASSNASK